MLLLGIYFSPPSLSSRNPERLTPLPHSHTGLKYAGWYVLTRNPCCWDSETPMHITLQFTARLTR